VDWGVEEGERAAVVVYHAEDILNWRVERVHGKNEVTLVVLAEKAESRGQSEEGDEFATEFVEQIRVLKLVEGRGESGEGESNGVTRPTYQVEIWQRVGAGKGRERDWVKTGTTIPLRAGRALERIPFVFGGAEHSRAAAGRVPLGHLKAVNLDHYRLDADYKHGLHYTALPTAWISGMESKDGLAIGSRTAWMLDNKDARVGFLEFTGQGLQSFERAMDRDERLMGVMGSRMLETQKRAYESAQTIELRQTAEHSSLGAMALSVSESLTGLLRWVCWWHGTEAKPENYGAEQVHFQLSEDYLPLTMQGAEVKALVEAWGAGAITREQLLEALQRGEVVPRGESVRGGTGEGDAKAVESRTSNIQHPTSNNQ